MTGPSRTTAGYEASTYGDRIAVVYDRIAHPPSDAETAATFLSALARGGPALELGIGTGRVALPLVQRGVEVHGIDASAAMVARLRAKPGGERIPVTIGNFGDLAIGRRFSLVFVVFNTFFGLLSQEAQVRCFARVAEHLTDDGVFVIEAFVPDLTLFDHDQRLDVRQVGSDAVELTASLHDPVGQRTNSAHVVLSPKGVDLYPVQVRYAWPAELDLMARLAGLRLRERWGGFGREPFSAASRLHVSVYERRVSGRRPAGGPGTSGSAGRTRAGSSRPGPVRSRSGRSRSR
jgi:SAM-dependent methyltransferase